MLEIDRLSGMELSNRIGRGELTCVQVALKFIENIEKNRHLNALIYFDRDETLCQATRLDECLKEKGTRLGRLHGVPIIVKDNIHVKKMPCTSGCPGLKNFVPDKDAWVVERLREEGALIMAKANMHELAYGSTSNNRFFGPVRNAQNAEYIAGGSSGGCGAAIAARMAPIALGTDTCGSIRMPSSMSGIFGFRPSMDRYSMHGIMPCSPTTDTVGPMTRHVDDLQLIDQILNVNNDVSWSESKGLIF